MLKEPIDVLLFGQEMISGNQIRRKNPVECDSVFGVQPLLLERDVGRIYFNAT